MWTRVHHWREEEEESEPGDTHVYARLNPEQEETIRQNVSIYIMFGLTCILVEPAMIWMGRQEYISWWKRKRMLHFPQLAASRTASLRALRKYTEKLNQIHTPTDDYTSSPWRSTLWTDYTRVSCLREKQSSQCSAKFITVYISIPMCSDLCKHARIRPLTNEQRHSEGTKWHARSRYCECDANF